MVYVKNWKRNANVPAMIPEVSPLPTCHLAFDADNCILRSSEVLLASCFFFVYIRLRNIADLFLKTGYETSPCLANRQNSNLSVLINNY